MGSKNKTLALLLVTLFLISLATFQTATAKAQIRTIIVPDNYSDIQTAINHANDGDTVLVRAGIYRYNEQNSIIVKPQSGIPDYGAVNYGVIINKSISMMGENGNTVLSMDLSQGVAFAVLIESDNVTFSGFTIKSLFDSTRYSSIGSIEILGSNCKIENNTFQESFKDSGSNQNIFYNTFEGGMSVGSNSIIENNIITNYTWGISIPHSSNVTIIRNSIINNTVAINLASFYYGFDDNITISYNNITNNSRYGIEFEGAVSNSRIYNNNITQNGIGVHLTNYALQKYPSLRNGNKIFYNNIIENTKNAYVETEYPYNLTTDELERRFVVGNVTDVISWDNGVVGNYWSDYNGSGSYVIGVNNTDHHPLSQQVNINSIAPTPTPISIGDLVLNLAIPIIVVAILAIVIVSVLLFRRHRKTISQNKSNV
jgi:parallel beta-helix repeat protein